MFWLWLANSAILIGAELVGEATVDLLLDDEQPKQPRIQDQQRAKEETPRLRFARGPRCLKK
jgi:hypothetical protein